MDRKSWLGALAEAKVISKLVEGEFDVFPQLSGKAPFDLVAHKDGHLLRVQIKGTSSQTRYGSYQVQLKSVRSNRTRNRIVHFDPSQYDVLATYIEPLGKVCFLQSDEVKGIRQLNLREEPRPQERKCWVIGQLEDVNRILRDHTRDA